MKEFLLELSELSSKQTLQLFRQQHTVDNKEAGTSNFDPVTQADKNAEKAIREKIESIYPDDAIFGEEFGTTNANAANGWIIDPIDGTRAFISGIPLWGTLIGRFENKQMVSGILSQPYIGEDYIATREGCWLIRNGTQTKLQTSATQNLSAAKLMTTSPRIFSQATQAPYNKLEDACMLARYGADCYAYGLLAMGNVDLVCEADLKNYDIAALIPIVEQAGGVITSWDGGPAFHGGNIIAAANQALHQKAIQILNFA